MKGEPSVAWLDMKLSQARLQKVHHQLDQDNDLVQMQKIPAYSPELNPVERFFQELRRRMKFRVFDTLEEAEKCLSEVLEEFYKDAERVKPLTLFPYITCARINLN